jgi:hypothetical protein
MAVRKNQTQGRLAPQRPKQEDQHPKQRRWQEALAALLDYRKRYGDCRVPYKLPKNPRLASWVARMRAAKKQNLLTKAQIQELDRIGFAWSIDPREHWEQHFKDLEAFRKKYGHCNVPRSYPLNRQLGYWVDKLRSSKRMGTLDKKLIRRLDKLGFCWSLLHRRFHRRDLDELVAILTAFKKRHGHCNLLAAHEGVERDLVDWLKDVRKSKKQGRLDPQRVRQLDKLGFVWHPQKQYPQEMYAALLDYRKRYGHCRVPNKWPENRRLASWVSRMRAAKKRNLLTDAQIQELDRIGFTWSIDPHDAWEQRFEELEAFKKKFGHCRVPTNYPLNSGLGHWASRIRTAKKRNLLTEAQIQKLDRLGFIWSIDRRYGWQRHLKELDAFRKKFGHCNVACNYSLNPALGHWVAKMRSAKKRNLLTEAQIQELDRIAFIWSIDPRRPWDEYFTEAEAFQKEHGHCNVPANYPLNRALGHWVAKMRSAKKRNLLTEAQIRELDRVGFTWNVDRHHSWQRHFKELEAFQKEHGHCNVPKHYPLIRALGQWVSRMRAAKKRNLLPEAKIQELEQIGFIWNIHHRRTWEERFTELEAFQKEHGHCNVPTQGRLNPALGQWVSSMRRKKRRGTLEKDRIRRLAALGFCWDRSTGTKHHE